MTLPCLICLRPWSVRPWFVLWLMNLFGVIGYFGWLDQWRLHNRNRPRLFRLLMEAYPLLSGEPGSSPVWSLCSVRSSARVNLQCQVCNIRCNLLTYSRFCFPMCLKRAYYWVIGPSPNRERYREEAITLTTSLSRNESCTKYKISISIDVQRLEGKKSRFWNVRSVGCDRCTWIVYDL